MDWNKDLVLTLKCRSCNKKLLNILKYKDTDLETKIKATCPFCDDESVVHTVKGAVYHGPITEEESVNQTQIYDIDMADTSDIITFIMRKK